jgi:bifunctional UDP-N-acetylglucosamine pyrophosphorylase/glucosamine-1-phosphate N-acetyltransferase
LHAVHGLSPQQIRVVVGSGREKVEEHISSISPKAEIVFQEKRGGTGHATQLALEGISPKGSVLVLAGDTPLLTTQSLAQLISFHNNGGFSASVMTAEHPDPTGYGRIIRADSGVYIFNGALLTSAITKLTTSNAQGELYLTDVLEIMRQAGGDVAAALIDDYVETLGVNDREQLAESGAYLRDRINSDLMREGVTITDPTTTWIDATASIESDVTIHPGSAILGNTTIKSGAVIGPRTTLQSCSVLEGARVIESNCQEAVIGKEASVGPYSYLRKGTVLGTGAKAGAFVEVKNSTIGDGSKVPHLSYVGDAKIGEGTNIGAATVFVNYDGVEKHETIVGDHVRIGSDSMLIAPVSIGDGAYTAAGSVISEDVPPGAIGVGRSRQRNVLGWVLRKRSGTKSAEAAARHTGSENGHKRG